MPLVAAILRERGYCEAPSIRAYLDPSLDALLDPFGLPDMAVAVDRIIAALDSGERILVHGDYDADGVTSTALMCRFLEKLGGDVCYFIPHRVHDNYGLSAAAITEAAAEGVRLVLALDCGITADEAIAAGVRVGVDTIVIDHHEPAGHLPPALAVVGTKRTDSQYPEICLASVGLAFKVASAICIRKGIAQEALQRAYLDLVAMGTIADVAPLTGENRALTRAGLDLIPQTRKAGLRALVKVCEIGDTVRTSDVAFRLGPRLNAVGRMADATQALELLLCTDEDEAHRLALQLDNVNRDRQREQETVLRDSTLR